jgi:ribosomal protein S27AE
MKQCFHKILAKVAIVQERPSLIIDDDISPACNITHSEDNILSPNKRVEVFTEYLLQEKGIPFDVAGVAISHSTPTDYYPQETHCAICIDKPELGPPYLFTDTAKLIDISIVIHSIRTYRRSCGKCGIEYSYRDYHDGVHNFNDHVLLSIALCKFLRSCLQQHTCLTRIFKVIEDTCCQKTSLPPINVLRQAYFHFEGLTKHNYNFTCDKCGYFPPVLIADVTKKTAFKVSGK